MEPGEAAGRAASGQRANVASAQRSEVDNDNAVPSHDDARMTAGCGRRGEVEKPGGGRLSVGPRAAGLGRRTTASRVDPGNCFRSDIEGLRALAVLLVLLYHSGIDALAGGYVGVDVFFVVSGFLITGLLWTELRQSARVSLVSFYARRARRLLPAAVLVLVTTLVASVALLSPLQAREVVSDATAAAFYVANHRFAALETDYLASQLPPSPLQYYWSLAVEEQFYLV